MTVALSPNRFVKSWMFLCIPLVLLSIAAAPTTAPTTRPTAVVAVAPSTQPAGRFEQELIRAPGTAPKKASTSQPAANLNSFDLEPGRVVLALGTVLALIVVMRFVLKRFFPNAISPKSIHSMRVISRLPLNPKQQLLLVQVGRRMVVVGNSGTQLSPISEITDPDEVAQLMGQLSDEQRAPELKSFVNLFGKARQDFDEEEVSSGEKQSLVPDVVSQDIESTTSELQGLISKVRDLSSQMRKQ